MMNFMICTAEFSVRFGSHAQVYTYKDILMDLGCIEWPLDIFLALK